MHNATFNNDVLQDGTATPPVDCASSEVQQQLARLLNSQTFRLSNQLRAFLAFSVNETLAGNAKSINAPTVAIEALGKGKDIDLKSEGLVRVQARQLRQKLTCYYENEGKRNPIKISIPLGGYSVRFERTNLSNLPPLVAAVHPRTQAVFKKLRICVMPVACRDDSSRATRIAETIPHDMTNALAPFCDFDACDAGYVHNAKLEQKTPSFALNSTLAWDNDVGHLTVSLQDAQSQAIIWSKQYTTKTLNCCSKIARRVAVALSSSSGILPTYIANKAELDDSFGICEANALIFQIVHYSSHPERQTFARLYYAIQDYISRSSIIPARVWSSIALLHLDAVRFRFAADLDHSVVLEKAVQSARKAVSEAPNCSNSWCILSKVYHEMRDFKRSESAANSALNHNANNTDAMILVGMNIWCRGQISEGLRLIDEAFELNKQPPSWYWLARVHEKLRIGDHRAALDDLSKVEMGNFFWPALLELAIIGHLNETMGRQRALKSLEVEAPWMLENLTAVFDEAPFPDAFKRNVINGVRVQQ